MTFTDADIAAMQSALDPEQLKLLDILADQIKDRETVLLIDGLMRVTVLSAILSGVDAPDFSAGMQHTWNHYADHLNAAAKTVS